MKSYYIIIQDNPPKHGLIYLKKTDINKIFESDNIAEIFILDAKNKKLYGSYKVIINSREDSSIKITEGNYRRGIYFYSENYKSNSIIKISHCEYLKIKRKLDVINNKMAETFFSYSLKNNKFKYQIIETSKSLYVACYEKDFDKKAFESIENEYKKLISIPSNEKGSKYSVIGNALMNMLIPEKNIRDFLLSRPRIIYLSDSDSKSKINIPFEILSIDKKFLSDDIIFSYTHAKNIIVNNSEKKDKIKLAIIAIPNDDLTNAYKELDIISKYSGNYVQIDTFKKYINYLEFVNILEHYDIVHIITHGKKSGIKLSDKYLLKHISGINNSPSLIFVNTCNGESDNNKLINSFISSGVPTVISGVGSLSDLSYIDFINNFYFNILNTESRLNTAEAYYFALTDNIDNSNIFLRYRFNGIPCYL